MRRRFVSILWPLLIVPCVVAGQTPGSLTQGQQVRVISRCELTGDSVPRCATPGAGWPNERTYSGRLERLSADTLHIRGRASEVVLAIPTSSVIRASIVDGTKGHFWTGAGIGFLGGALIGAIIGSGQDLSGSFLFSNANPTVLGVVLGAPAGLLVGGVIGALTRSERWRAVVIKDHRISVKPRLDAIGLTVGLMF